jgi:small multidrug resistance family-3 protein
MFKNMAIIKSLFYFLLAGFCEIAGGYLVWLWLREGRGIQVAIAGWLLLILYGIIPTLQPTHFGRVYAAYGGVFVVLSLLWGWQVDRMLPDRQDGIGCFFVVLGVIIMMYYPRR